MVTIERKGSENLAKSGATAVDQSNLGQAPRLKSAPFQISDSQYGTPYCLLKTDFRWESRA